jgi:Protein of unknown function (DUF3108)
MHIARRVMGLALVTGLFAGAGAAEAEELAAFYRATWAGLPAAEIRLGLGDTASDYRDEIRIETQGLPRLLTKFRAEVRGEGRLARDGRAAPARYDARYDLRKRRDQHASLRFVERDGAVIAERTAEDTSRKPPLPEVHRRDVLDPIAALAFIRQELRTNPPKPGHTFTIPVFDDARRFDVAVRVVAVGGAEDVIRLRLMLKPIAGFKGETSEDGDPDRAPRPVDLTLSNDARLLPLSLKVSIAFMPVSLWLDHVCASFASCGPGG